MAKPSDARSRAGSPERVLVAAVFVISLLLIAAYIGNALWNTLHLSRADGRALFAAATLPAPFLGSVVPQWAEVASATGFVALVALAVLMGRAASRRREAKPFADADPADIFIAATPRNNAPRSSLLRPANKTDMPDTLRPPAL